MTNEELVKAYQDGDKEAMNEIVEKNTGLVFMIANRYMNSLDNSYLERDDLEQLGFMGLMEAVKGFDLSKGFKFSSYAGTSIMGHITRGVRVSTPWEKRSDTSGDMAKVTSVNSFLPGSEDMTYMDILKDDHAENDFHNLIDQLDREIMRKDIFAVMGRVFNPYDKEKNALILKYGLNGKEYTAREIADIYDVKYEKARQWLDKGMRRIRSSKAGIQLCRKYKDEIVLNRYMERLVKLEYKDPSYYVQIQEWVKQMQKSQDQRTIFIKHSKNRAKLEPLGKNIAYKSH